MWPNPQESADFVTLTEEILTGKLHFLFSEGKTGGKCILQSSLPEIQLQHLMKLR